MRRDIYATNHSVYTTRFSRKSLIEHVHIIHTYICIYINLCTGWNVHVGPNKCVSAFSKSTTIFSNLRASKGRIFQILLSSRTCEDVRTRTTSKCHSFLRIKIPFIKDRKWQRTFIT
ncbi:uncharacterized protein LOC143150864 [Ptiloglossa arizonensis]|uniref:uncharacterized protein LOC143150864 n=1 Tax=Ptiloglossa arizonensis TaxID=3350558 RepID=UPI003F9FFFE5